MFRMILLASLAILMMSCGGGAARTYNLPDDTKIFLTSVDVKLHSSCDRLDYPSEKEVGELFYTSITEALRNKGVLGGEQAEYSISFVIDYNRIFMGQGFGVCKNYGNGMVDYRGDLFRNGVLVAGRAGTNLFLDRGLFGNLKAIGGQLAGTLDQEAEITEIRGISEAIVKDLSRYYVVAE